MKKCFVVLIMAIVLFASVCSAEDSEEVSLGGIRLGMSYEEVVAMYGEPTVKFDELYDNGSIKAKYIEYRDNVQIIFSDNNGNFGNVRNVFVIADNGWALPSGIKVSSKESDFISIYGAGKGKSKGRYGEYVKISISRFESIGYSVPDTGNATDKINSLQITNMGALAHTFIRKDPYSNSKIRYIN